MNALITVIISFFFVLLSGILNGVSETLKWHHLAFVAIYLLYQYSDAKGDVAIEQGKQGPWHTWGAVTACLFIAVLGFAQFGISWYTPIAVTVLIGLRLPVFNILHNLAKGDKWYYVGKKAKTDILIRKWFPFINFDR